MNRILIVLMLVAGLAGCERSQKKPAAARPARAAMTQKQAEEAVWALPEVARWANNVRRKSRGRVVPVCKADETPADGGAWVLSFWESNPKNLNMWNRFRVDPANGEITVWNPVRSQYVSLADWRKKIALE